MSLAALPRLWLCNGAGTWLAERHAQRAPRAPTHAKAKMKLPKIVERCRVDKPEHFRLADHDPAENFGLAIDKDSVKAMLSEGLARLTERQEVLYAQASGRCWSCCKAWMPRARTASSST